MNGFDFGKLLLVMEMEELTREMILGELPGPKLDRWVAENIMAIPQLYAYTHTAGDEKIYFWSEDEEDLAIRDHALSVELPKYSTDIAEAWKVVEELNSRGLSFSLELDSMGRVHAKGGQAGLDCSGAVFDDQGFLCTVPEAICKTALLLVLENRKAQADALKREAGSFGMEYKL